MYINVYDRVRGWERQEGARLLPPPIAPGSSDYVFKSGFFSDRMERNYIKN
jgi:hypothetical protein